MRPYLFILLSIFLLTGCTSETDPSNEKKIIGVKIYEHDGDFAELFAIWKEVGINTVFASTSLLSNDEFRHLANTNGIKTFAILPIFYAPDELEKDPSLFSITQNGKNAELEWVKFVCPSDSMYRQSKIDFIAEFVKQYHPDAVSLDFIRHFAYWEKVYPGTPFDSLPNTCFDERCLSKFQKDMKINIPGEVGTPGEIYAWIKENQFKDWVDWKSTLITSMVQEIVTTIKKIDKDIIVNLHAVSWREDDFGGAILSVVGQDFKALSNSIDYISPMTYSHMVKRPPEWIHSVTVDVAKKSSAKIIPSIQVGIAYLSDTLSVEEFEQCLIQSLKTPSEGVVFWNWDALFADKKKLEVVKSHFHSI